MTRLLLRLAQDPDELPEPTTLPADVVLGALALVTVALCFLALFVLKQPPRGQEPGAPE